MKLWWPHAEALYAHLLDWSITRDAARLGGGSCAPTPGRSRTSPTRSTGEWYGYLDRRGEVTHRFKGGPYKGCFHVPRALWLCWRLLRKLENEA